MEQEMQQQGPRAHLGPSQNRWRYTSDRSLGSALAGSPSRALGPLVVSMSGWDPEGSTLLCREQHQYHHHLHHRPPPHHSIAIIPCPHSYRSVVNVSGPAGQKTLLPGSPSSTQSSPRRPWKYKTRKPHLTHQAQGCGGKGGLLPSLVCHRCSPHFLSTLHPLRTAPPMCWALSLLCPSTPGRQREEV